LISRPRLLKFLSEVVCGMSLNAAIFLLQRDEQASLPPENPHERLIGWVTGFVDGEGCFSINFIRQPDRINRRGYKSGFQVAHEFAVTQGARSVESLELLVEFFGVGAVYLNRRYDNHREHMYRYCVRKRLDLIEVIVPFFKRYPLRTSKWEEFTKFADCLRLMQLRSHLTTKGLIEIVKVAETMNHCKSRTEIMRRLQTATTSFDLGVQTTQPARS
jgi:hypothetical protein